jgi:hypothetical protein
VITFVVCEIRLQNVVLLLLWTTGSKREEVANQYA